MAAQKTKHHAKIIETAERLLQGLASDIKHLGPLTEEAADKLVHTAFTISKAFHKEIGTVDETGK